MQSIQHTLQSITMKTEDVSTAVASLIDVPVKIVIFNIGGSNFGTHCLLTLKDPSNLILEVRSLSCSRSIAETLNAVSLPPPTEMLQTARLTAEAALSKAKRLDDGKVIGVGVVCDFNLDISVNHQCIIVIASSDKKELDVYDFVYKSIRTRIEEDALAGHILIHALGDILKADKMLDAAAYHDPNESIKKFLM